MPVTWRTWACPLQVLCMHPIHCTLFMSCKLEEVPEWPWPQWVSSPPASSNWLWPAVLPGIAGSPVCCNPAAKSTRPTRASGRTPTQRQPGGTLTKAGRMSPRRTSSRRGIDHKGRLYEFPSVYKTLVSILTAFAGLGDMLWTGCICLDCHMQSFDTSAVLLLLKQAA